MKIYRKVLLIIQWIIFSALIFYFSSMPKVEFIPESLLSRDKLLHFIGFFFYGISTQLFINTIFQNKKQATKNIFVLIIGIIYPLSDEIHQSYVPGRDSDIYDFLTDLVGIILSLLIFTLILKAFDKFKHSRNAKIS